MTELNVKVKTPGFKKLMWDNYLLYTWGIGRGFLTQKALTIKEKINKLDFTKNFCSLNTTEL